LSGQKDKSPIAAVFGCSGTALTDQERSFFRDVRPAGFILFARNVDTPDQVRGLVDDLRASVDSENAPVLIDQEGGRVARLKPPQWPAFPPAALFGELARHDPDAGREAVRLNARCIGGMLRSLGINVDCLPLLDIRIPGAHDVIGDRAYAEDPDTVALLGRACCEGLMQAGVLPVIKHMPGHGRTRLDTHKALPVVDASHQDLSDTDFRPFRALADMPLGMSAHIVFSALDPSAPATTSARVIRDVIRGEIGFEGLLFTDDIGMKALGGPFGGRARAALDAGCDLVLHCSGDMAEMVDTATGCDRMPDRARRRLDDALGLVTNFGPVDIDAEFGQVKELFNRFNVLLTA
jgi:beta-N-acetylhexosaminidase